MKTYIVERNIPGVDDLDAQALSQAAATSNAALAQLSPRVQWVESFVTQDKTFCVYRAEDEAGVHEHARISGFPASKVTEVARKFDPTSAPA